MIVVAVSVAALVAGVGLLGEEEGHHHHGRERRQALQVSRGEERRGEERRGEERRFFIRYSFGKDETNECVPIVVHVRRVGLA
jgi:hypothetical protein